jgi:carbonic anhydrase
LHLVHQGVDDPTKLAVLGMFLHLGSDHTALHPDAQVLSEVIECGKKVRTKTPISLEAKLPESRSSFARYNGSLTTPPCSENVTWTVFTEPVEVSSEQASLIKCNKANKRVIES